MSDLINHPLSSEPIIEKINEEINKEIPFVKKEIEFVKGAIQTAPVSLWVFLGVVVLLVLFIVAHI